MKNKRRVIIPGIAVLLLLLVVGSAYSFYATPVSNSFTDRSASISVPCLDITVTETNAINLSNQVPVTDNYGKSLTPATVTITNNCSDTQDYTLTLNSISNSSSNYANNYIQDEAIKVAVKKDGSEKFTKSLGNIAEITSEDSNYTLITTQLAADYTSPSYTLQSSRILDKGTLDGNGTVTYAVNMWIDYYEGCGEDTCNNSTQNKLYNGIFYILGNATSGTIPRNLAIGDFVTYDAGTWTQEEIASIQVGPNSSLVSANNSLSKPTTYCQFGGFTVGTSRNSGAVEYSATNYMYAKMYDNGNSSNQLPISGWRIWDIDEENETITLVSAANPEDYYHSSVQNTYAYISQYILTGTINAEWSEASTAESTYTKRDWSMYENETYGATNARILSNGELANWYNKNFGTNISDTLYNQNTTFQMIYAEPYLKYQNLIDNHTFYLLGVANKSTFMRYVIPSNRYVSGGTYNAIGARLLVSIPLESLVGSEDIGDRTVTLDGMIWSGGTYGTETTQTYNVWELNEVDEPELDELVYYAFGDPTTSSPTTPPAGKNVYVALYPGGEKAVCINRNSTQHCFKSNNWAVEQAHVQEVFSDISCDVDSSYVTCGASDFDCNVYSDGLVDCTDQGTYEGCGVHSGGYVACS